MGWRWVLERRAAWRYRLKSLYQPEGQWQRGNEEKNMEEKLRILKMVEEGKLTAEQAVELLKALEGTAPENPSVYRIFRKPSAPVV